MEEYQSQIVDYFSQQNEKAKSSKSRRRKIVDTFLAPSHLTGINHLIKTYPQLLIDTISPFKVRYTNQLADTFISRIFPEILEKESSKGFWEKLGFKGKNNQGNES
ncbi:MAG: hypothetical protein LBU27_02295 [Candidatus Peribacteria bacterium]|nr:hypothetical protein [Candidatus Peribacteria bacterium]